MNIEDNPQYKQFLEQMRQLGCIGMASNGAAKPGEEYGQFAQMVLGKDECHRRAMAWDIIHD